MGYPVHQLFIVDSLLSMWVFRLEDKVEVFVNAQFELSQVIKANYESKYIEYIA